MNLWPAVTVALHQRKLSYSAILNTRATNEWINLWMQCTKTRLYSLLGRLGETGAVQHKRCWNVPVPKKILHSEFHKSGHHQGEPRGHLKNIKYVGDAFYRTARKHSVKGGTCRWPVAVFTSGKINHRKTTPKSESGVQLAQDPCQQQDQYTQLTAKQRQCKFQRRWNWNTTNLCVGTVRGEMRWYYLLACIVPHTLNGNFRYLKRKLAWPCQSDSLRWNNSATTHKSNPIFTVCLLAAVWSSSAVFMLQSGLQMPSTL